MLPIRPMLALALTGALVLSACGDDDGGGDDAVVVSDEINVGRTTEPVSQLMAEIYGQGLENAGYRIGRKDPVADRAAAVAGLEAGNLQLVPEFSSALLDHFTAEGTAPSDAATVEDQMTELRAALPPTLTVFEPANVDNATVIACGPAAVEEFGLAKVGDLAAADLTLGGSAEFSDATAGGLDALNAAYGTQLTVTTVADVAAAITAGTVDCGAVNALAPEIVTAGLIVLEDDKRFAPPDSLVALMTLEAGQADVQAVIDSLNVSLTTDVVRSLLVKIELDALSYDVVAKQYLATQATAG